MPTRLFLFIICLAVSSSLFAAEPSRGDKMIADYFRLETAKLTKQTQQRLQAVKTPDDWKHLKKELRSELFEMLGLDPLPPKTDLKAVVTGKVEHEEFTVENVHFQSKPHLYVTGNLYLPKNRKANEKLPAILYVCGHGGVKKNGISYGNKVHYQHHGAWFARNGYVCLTIDTLQLGEIEGMHHGTYKYKEWWWNARGYTSAGVEAWNCIRALDYLESRKEVDAKKMGVTGRSGGGAYSWWVTALDDRIQAAVPVAGITSLHNHVVDGTVEGHCDCMFQVNTYRWDYPLVAALAAPRPLLISNSDQDRIFPLEGVVDVYSKIRHLYSLHKEPRKLGLQITEGPHLDTQQLRIHAFHWFNKYLKGQNPSPLIEMAAVPFFKPEQLKVFKTIPADQINTKIQQTFTLKAKPPVVPKTKAEWEKQQAIWMKQLKEKCFRGWPDLKPDSLHLKKISETSREDMKLTHYQFQSEPTITLDLYMVHPDELKLDNFKSFSLFVLDQKALKVFVARMKRSFPDQFSEYIKIKQDEPTNDPHKSGKYAAYRYSGCYFVPRGIGLTSWSQNKRKQTQIRRRFMQLGQTQDSMRVWDIRRAVQAIQLIPKLNKKPLRITSENEMAVNVLYASLFESNIKKITLAYPSKSHQNGSIYLNVLRYLDIPQAATMAASRTKVEVKQKKLGGWEYPKQVGKALGWKQGQFEEYLYSHEPINQSKAK